MKPASNSDLVWARLKYHVYWPARIVNAPMFLQPIPARKTCVLFFGTKNFGIIEADQIKDYTTHRDDLMSKCNSTNFKNAVKSMDEYMSDRLKFRIHASVKPIRNQIRIKTERAPNAVDVSIPKINRIETHKKMKCATISPTPTAKWNAEKQQLVRKIVDCKAENQQITLDLKKRSSAYDTLMSEKLKAEQLHLEKVNGISCELNALKTELAALKNHHAKKESEFNSVYHENQTLKARINQLQANQQATTSANDATPKTSNGASDIYDIEKIVDHKKKKDGLHFRVRWVNYTENDDTWEHESNVMCSLCKYMRKKKLN